jgi:hypothetical protein
MARIQHAVSYLGNWLRAAHLVTAVVLAGALAGALAVPGRPAAASAVRVAAAPTCPRWAVVRPPDPGAQLDALFGVAVLSARDIWAVGDYTDASGRYRTLIEQWNGRAWRRVPSPSPGIGSNYLASVTALAPGNIWAVGDYSTRPGGITPNKTLILHWNGRAWRQVPSPSPGSFIDELNAVRRVSATSIWAVGMYAGPDTHDKSLILHWNGRAWSRVPSPNPGRLNNSLDGLAAASARSVWTTELYNSSSGIAGTSLILHWNGRTWSRAAAGPAGSELIDVSASSATNAWAVGSDRKGFSMALHWNGRAWRRVATPNLRPNQLINGLQSVTVLSPTSAWAVGVAQNVFSVFEGTAIEMHWNGRSWSMMTSPAPGGNSGLFDVQATSAVSPWAVGEYGLSNQVQRTLVFRCR